MQLLKRARQNRQDKGHLRQVLWNEKQARPQVPVCAPPSPSTGAERTHLSPIPLLCAVCLCSSRYKDAMFCVFQCHPKLGVVNWSNWGQGRSNMESTWKRSWLMSKLLSWQTHKFIKCEKKKSQITPNCSFWLLKVKWDIGQGYGEGLTVFTLCICVIWICWQWACFYILITEQLYWSIIYIPQNFPTLSVQFNDC